MKSIFVFVCLAFLFAPKKTVLDRVKREMFFDIYCVFLAIFIPLIFLDCLYMLFSGASFLNALHIYITNLLPISANAKFLISIAEVVVCGIAVLWKADTLNVEETEAVSKLDLESMLSENDDSDSEEQVVTDDAYILYKDDIAKSIDDIVQLTKHIRDDSLRCNIVEISKIIVAIKDNADENEYRHGNLSKMNSYYLPEFKKFIENYLELQSLNGIVDVRSAMKSMTKNIEVSKDIFLGLLKEAIEGDVMDMTSDGSVYQQVAVRNGLLNDSNTLNLSV